jgi:hypothetical protein
MDRETLANQLRTCYFELPASVMPAYLKTDEQRKSVELITEEELSNSLGYLKFDGDGGYDIWEMSGFVTDDNGSMVLIVSYGSGLDWYTVHSFKTLNYNIKTKQFAEIEFPVDGRYAADDLIGEIINEKGVNITNKAKTYFNLTQKVRINFNENGFEVNADLWDFWQGADNNVSAEIKALCNNDYEFYENNQQQPTVGYKWNGKQFVKDND